MWPQRAARPDGLTRHTLCPPFQVKEGQRGLNVLLGQMGSLYTRSSSAAHRSRPLSPSAALPLSPSAAPPLTPSAAPPHPPAASEAPGYPTGGGSTTDGAHPAYGSRPGSGSKDTPRSRSNITETGMPTALDPPQLTPADPDPDLGCSMDVDALNVALDAALGPAPTPPPPAERPPSSFKTLMVRRPAAAGAGEMGVLGDTGPGPGSRPLTTEQDSGMLLPGEGYATARGGPCYCRGGPCYCRGGPCHCRGGPCYCRGGPYYWRVRAMLLSGEGHDIAITNLNSHFSETLNR